MGREAGFVHPYKKTNPFRHPKTGAMKMVICMDDDTFAEIDAAARKNNCSVSAQARNFIEWGIMAANADDYA